MESSLLTEEVNWKNVETSKSGSALVVHGRLVERSKGNDKNQSQAIPRPETWNVTIVTRRVTLRRIVTN